MMLWTATLTAGRASGRIGSGVGFGRGGVGILEPESYEHEPGSTVDFTRLAVFDDGVDRLRVQVNLGQGTQGTEMAGLWLKVSDDLAFEFGEPHNTDFSFDRRHFEWIFDLPEGSLGWTAGSDYEVSLWDKQPPGTSQPVQRLWSATLTPGADDYGVDLGRGVGFGKTIAGTLDPGGYEYEPGSTAEFDRLVVLTDDADRLYVAVNKEAASAMDGLWLRVSDHLAVQLGQPDTVGTFTAHWFFDIGDGVLDWTAGSDYEVSLWGSQPPTLPVPPKQLWSATMTVGEETYPEGRGLGYLGGASGSLSPKVFEYEPGSTLTIDGILWFPDGDDILSVNTFALAGSDGLIGLWLRVSDHLAVELDATTRNGKIWNVDIAEGLLDWKSGDSLEVSLWDRDPTAD